MPKRYRLLNKVLTSTTFSPSRESFSQLTSTAWRDDMKFIDTRPLVFDVAPLLPIISSRLLAISLAEKFIIPLIPIFILFRIERFNVWQCNNYFYFSVGVERKARMEIKIEKYFKIGRLGIFKFIKFQMQFDKFWNFLKILELGSMMRKKLNFYIILINW